MKLLNIVVAALIVGTYICLRYRGYFLQDGSIPGVTGSPAPEQRRENVKNFLIVAFLICLIYPWRGGAVFMFLSGLAVFIFAVVVVFLVLIARLLWRLGSK